MLTPCLLTAQENNLRVLSKKCGGIPKLSSIEYSQRQGIDHRDLKLFRAKYCSETGNVVENFGMNFENPS